VVGITGSIKSMVLEGGVHGGGSSVSGGALQVGNSCGRGGGSIQFCSPCKGSSGQIPVL
jgi:hypothetical protein